MNHIAYPYTCRWTTKDELEFVAVLVQHGNRLALANYVGLCEYRRWDEQVDGEQCREAAQRALAVLSAAAAAAAKRTHA